MSKARLSKLHRDLEKKDDRKKTSKESAKNIPRGERTNFLKITITLPPDLWVALKTIGTQRKANGDCDYDVSSLIRESLSEWIKRQK